MADDHFLRLVSLACHDLRTPLATVSGFAKTLERTGGLDEREARFVELIDAASGQMADLLDLLGLAVRIASGRYEPSLQQADTLELASSDTPGLTARGNGEAIETDAAAVGRALAALGGAAIRHGGVDAASWTVQGRLLELAPVNEGAAPVVTGEEPKDLGALVARMVVERLGGSLALEGDTLRVELGGP
jgi:signal transduction histidine kinase